MQQVTGTTNARCGTTPAFARPLAVRLAAALA